MDRLRKVLLSFKNGEIGMEEVLTAICESSVAPLGSACLDTARQARRGFGEVVFCEGKTPEQVAEISSRIVEVDGLLLATRADEAHYEAVKRVLPDVEFHRRARCITYGKEKVKRTGSVVVVAAGTSDLGVAEEALITAEMTGSNAELVADVGVAGLHRLTPHIDRLRRARAVVVVAGMEGALPSVVAGLVNVPVVAVPTSVGYGASFGGLAALLAMLNCCCPGVAVVNIDNGFGAGYFASLVNRRSDYGGGEDAEAVT